MKSEIIRNITYKILSEQNGNFHIKEMTFERLFLNRRAEGDDWEFVYALCDIANDVIKLQVGESLYFKPNRDEPSKGIIARIQ